MTSGLFVDVKHIQLGMIRRPAGVIVAVEGTSYPGFDPVNGAFPPSMILNDGTGFWSGFSSALVGGICNLQDGLFDSYLVPYKAPTIPMWNGVQEAREKVVAWLDNYQKTFYLRWGVYAPIVLTGYSQGSMAIDQVFMLDILADGGRLNYLKNYVYRIYQFGHIFRTPGVAKGNVLIGQSESIIVDGQESGGIGCGLDVPLDVVALLAPDGKPIYYSCALKGDIYTCCAVGTNPWTAPAKEGKVGYIFEQIIMKPTLTGMIKTLTVLGEPISAF
jgi:hypothetical protein